MLCHIHEKTVLLKYLKKTSYRSIFENIFDTDHQNNYVEA